MVPKLIAFCGLKGSGKDTAATFYRDWFYDNLQYVSSEPDIEDVTQIVLDQINFATPVKTMCGYVFGLTVKEMNDPELKEQVLDRYPYQSPRHIMQAFATEGMRSIWPDVWIERWERTALNCLEEDSYVVVTDLRFRNEFELVKSMEGYVIRIVRPGLVPDGHASEAEASTFNVDCEIQNDGGLDDLRDSVVTLLDSMHNDTLHDEDNENIRNIEVTLGGKQNE